MFCQRSGHFTWVRPCSLHLYPGHSFGTLQNMNFKFISVRSCCTDTWMYDQVTDKTNWSSLTASLSRAGNNESSIMQAPTHCFKHLFHLFPRSWTVCIHTKNMYIAQMIMVWKKCKTVGVDPSPQFRTFQGQKGAIIINIKRLCKYTLKHYVLE